MAEGTPFGDLIQPFTIESLGVGGRIVRLSEALDRMLAPHGYPKPVAGMLAETAVLAAALAGGLKYNGVFILQTRSDGPVPTLVADISSVGDLRGWAKFDAERVAASGEEAQAGALLGSGHMVFTVDQGPDTERYQGITEIVGPALEDCARNYFRHSEQLETEVLLAADQAADDRVRAGALVLQRLPPRSGRDAEPASVEDWTRATVLMKTLSTGELLDPNLTPADLLYRLYHEETVRLFAPKPLRHACRCSRERVERTLRSFPRAEIEDLEVEGAVVVTCEFCKAEYRFGGEDIDRLYAT